MKPGSWNRIKYYLHHERWLKREEFNLPTQNTTVLIFPAANDFYFEFNAFQMLSFGLGIQRFFSSARFSNCTYLHTDSLIVHFPNNP